MKLIKNIDWVGANLAVDGQKYQMMLMADLLQKAERANQHLMEDVMMYTRRRVKRRLKDC